MPQNRQGRLTKLLQLMCEPVDHYHINQLLYQIVICYILNMTIEIKTPVTKEKVQQAIKQLAEESGKKNLRRHFGKLKRNIEGLEYQTQVRNEWI